MIIASETKRKNRVKNVSKLEIPLDGGFNLFLSLYGYLRKKMCFCAHNA